VVSKEGRPTGLLIRADLVVDSNSYMR